MPLITGRLLAAGAWLGFAALAVVTGGRLVLSCELGESLPAFVRALGPSHCAPPSVEDPRLADLEQAVAAANAVNRAREMQLIQRAAICERSCPVPTPVPTPAPRDAEARQIEERAQQRGGRTGKLTITLIWETRDDLDLEVICGQNMITTANPSARQGPGPGICGDGVLDVDANHRMRDSRTDPVENVHFTSDIPDALLQVRVVPFQTGNAQPIPYRVMVKTETEERICRGVVQGVDRSASVLQGFSELPIAFRQGLPLPACENRREQVFACPPGQVCRKN